MFSRQKAPLSDANFPFAIMHFYCKTVNKKVRTFLKNESKIVRLVIDDEPLFL
ncbi:hypothetical protein FD27_GL000626 [Limosilactobacillus frumenti DSM 13145]|uniref:Uncharacterized protein n=1 Tax=Limosilactobacillus frumenti DSM 13145 TaxID=1423746 RepID=A0A0R1P6M1_9LACO|nr:hypothetical protein FD27_GL000626 [Limosilactobacillus frumenti DSM 13145]